MPTTDSSNSTRGQVIWLHGLSGAGKTTLVELFSAEVRARNIPVLVLDGDTVRSGLCAGLGFSEDDRAENLRRSAEVAKLAIASGIWVVAAFITPLEAHRKLVARIVGADAISFVYLDAPIDVCELRDVKGLYARARDGRLPQMTGVSSLFEPPSDPDLTLHTGTSTAEACVAELLDFAFSRAGTK